jgi:hypothetical protein
MSTRNLSVVVVALLALAAPARADFNRTTLLIDTPTADVMPPGTIAISTIVTFPLIRSADNPGWEGGASVRVAPIDGLEVLLTAYTPKDYVMGATYQLISGQPLRVGLLQLLHIIDPFKSKLRWEEAQQTSLAVGVYDVGIHSYVSPLGNGLDDAWPDWKYQDTTGRVIRPYENFSAFVVASVPLTGLARISVGLGRGRFVGYDRANDYMNTDIFFKGYHQWAIGVFGGFELYLTPQVALCAEADSRDANAGIKGFFGPVSVLVSVCKVEGLIAKSKEHRFGRLAVDVSWQFDKLLRKN